MERDDEGFRAFVAGQMPVLRKLAFATCGNWHTAEDAVANALVKIYPRWGRLERPDLYVKTMVVRAVIDEGRRPWRRERPAGDGLPDSALPDPAGLTDERLRLRAALLAVPKRQRATLVLRFYLELSVKEAAEVLGCSEGTVKSQVSRGLDRLRDVLAGMDMDLDEAVRAEEWINAGA